MPNLHKLTPLAAAVLLAVAAVAEAGGGAYMGGGGGGGGRSASGGSFGGGASAGRSGGGFGGGASVGRGGGGGSMSAPSASFASRGGGQGSWNGNRDNVNGNHGNWNGNGNHGHWNGNHGNWHGGRYWGYAGWYPYWGGWWWPAFGASVALASTWPYYGATTTYVEPYPTYYYGAPAGADYGAPVGTVIQRQEPSAAPAPQGPAVRLYCPATNAFYPQVTECNQQWLKVLPNDGAAPSPNSYVPQSAPRSRAPAVQQDDRSVSRGGAGTASLAAPRLANATSTISGSVPISASAELAFRDAATIAVALNTARRIPAPRMALPGAGPGETVVARLNAE
ncbi:MAG: hypothetical protein ABI585_00060 [Betaproteobacteria bacterium]